MTRKNVQKRASANRDCGRLFCLLVAGSVLLPLEGEAQDIFLVPGLVPLGSSPNALLVDDFDGDERPDVAAAMDSRDEVAVLLNDPDEELTRLGSPGVYDVEESPMTLASGDLDGSGLPDLFVVNGGSASVSVLLNRGDGTFRAGTTLEVNPNPRVARLHDFDGDGDLDAVTGGSTSKDLQIFFGDGRGGFRLKDTIRLNGNPHAMTVDDYDGDSVHDIFAVYANSEFGGVNWIKGLSTGEFKDAVKTTLYADGEVVPRYQASGDFDGDRKAEAAVLTDQQKLLFLRLQGDGTFHVEDLGTAPGVDRHFGFVVASDLSADGLLDVLVPVDLDSSFAVRVFRGRGDESFHSPEDYLLGEYQRSAAVVDLNGDALPDLLGGQESPDGVRVLLSSGPGRLGMRAIVPLGAAPRALAACDLKGDGVLELLAVTSDALHIVAASEGQKWSVKKEELEGRSLQDLAVGRFGAGGEKEVALVDLSSKELLVAPLDSSLELGPLTVRRVHELPGKIAAGDFDRDGLDDAAVTHAAFSSVMLLLRPGDEAGDPDEDRRDIPVGSGQTAIHAARMDRDGFLDLTVGTLQDIRILLGDGAGNFPEERIIEGYPKARALRSGDLDRDGEMDLVAAVGKKVVAFLSPLGEGFETREVSLSSDVQALQVHDADGDGRLDVLAAVGDSVAFLRAGQDGVLAEPEYYRVGSSPRALAIADVTGDGRSDCATADFDSRSLSILPGSVARSEPRFRRGDVDGDAIIQLTDPIVTLLALFLGRAEFDCEDAADANDDGTVNLTDAVSVLVYLFLGGPPPESPGPANCGEDPTSDALGDCNYPSCR